MLSEKEYYERLYAKGECSWKALYGERNVRAEQFYHDVLEYGWVRAINIAKDDSTLKAYEAMGTPVSYVYEYRLQVMRTVNSAKFDTYAEYQKWLEIRLKEAREQDDWDMENFAWPGRLYNPEDREEIDE